MSENLRLAHERNDEVIERIYIGRRFRNDTERLEKLLDMYTKMTPESDYSRTDVYSVILQGELISCPLKFIRRKVRS